MIYILWEDFFLDFAYFKKTYFENKTPIHQNN